MLLCDWLSIKQTHFKGELPIINNGHIFAVDVAGEIEWTTSAKFEHVGSYDTKIRIKCDGNSITLDGNIGRFARPDNVFGYSVTQCVYIANKMLETFGLPPFTPKRLNQNMGKRADGASITRVDLTQNYAAGNNQKAIRLVHYLAGQDAGRRATVKQYGDNGVTWNEGSKYQSSKLYIKAESMGKHASQKLTDWVKSTGLVRHEITLRSRYLTQKKLDDIADWQIIENGKVTDMDNVIYNRFTEVLTRGSAVQSTLEQIPGRFGHIALAWRAGKNVWGEETVTLRTRQMWRKALLPYGIDIKQQSNLVRLNTRIEVITLQAAIAPEWYWQESRAA